MAASKGIVFALVLVIASAGFLAFELNVPTSNSFSLPPVPSNAAHYQNITLYADASGWNYNVKGFVINPTIVLLPDTVVNFTVIEEDNQPHTLTVAYGGAETSVSQTLLSTGQITTTPGHVSHTQAYFNQTGEYTYWCIVHPQTMVGHIWVNATLPIFQLPSPPANMSVNSHQTLYANSNGWNYSHGAVNPTLYFETGSLTEFTIIQGDNNNHDFYIAPGSAVSTYSQELLNSTALGTKIGDVAHFVAFFNLTGEYTYWDSHDVNSTVGHIFVVTNITTVNLVAEKTGLNYSGSLSGAMFEKNGTVLHFQVSDPTNANYSVAISLGYNTSNNYTTVISGTNTSATGFFLLGSVGTFAVFNGLNNSTHHLLYSYIKIVNVTLYAGISTWTTPKGVVNPTINVTEGDLVMFTVVNKDNLSHSLMINAGKGESVGTAVNVVTVAPGVANATGYFLFSLKGTYTYWDFYHSSTAVGIINSSASSTASSAIGEIPYQ